MAGPRLITTAARSAPRGPKVRMSELPPGTKVLSPGDAGYHGPQGGNSGKRTEWGIRSRYENDRDATKAKWAAQDRRWGRLNYGTAAGLAASGVGGGVAMHLLGRRQAGRLKEGRYDRGIGVKKVWETSMPFVRRATRSRGAFDVTSMPARVSREQRLASWAADPNHAEKLMVGSSLLGGGGFLAGAASSNKQITEARRKRRAQLRRQGVAKSRGGAAFMLRHAKEQMRPSALASSQLTSPQTIGFGALGAGALAGGHSGHTEGRKTTTGERAVLGGVAGQAAYQGGTYASNAIANARHGTIYKDPARRRGYKDTRDKKIVEGHKAKHGLTNPNVPSDFKGFYRHFPTDVKGGRHLRINAHLTTGKRGFLVGTGMTAVGAAAGARTGHGRKQDVGKALYQREDRISPIRAATLGAGGLLTAYGLSHSGMVGRAIGRGIKLATLDGNQRAAEALMRAQAARGAIRVGLAPGEAALRRIRAVDEALNRVPRSIRPEVATAAGLLLTTKAIPVQRTHYQQISAPVPSYTRAW